MTAPAGRPRLQPAARPRAEPTIGLINIVFLMLVFFLIAGTIGPRPPERLELVRLAAMAVPMPPDVLVLGADGSLRHRGLPTTPEAYLATLSGDEPVARLMPDRAAPAPALVATAGALQRAGAARVLLLGARGP